MMMAEEALIGRQNAGEEWLTFNQAFEACRAESEADRPTTWVGPGWLRRKREQGSESVRGVFGELIW